MDYQTPIRNSPDLDDGVGGGGGEFSSFSVVMSLEDSVHGGYFYFSPFMLLFLLPTTAVYKHNGILI